MTRNYTMYVRDILDAIESVELFLGNMSFEQFQSDDKTLSAVIRKLEVIGEAAKQIPEEIRSLSPDIPWKEVSGMRDKLIHFYFGVDHELVWHAIKDRLPLLKNEMLKIK